MIADVTPRSGRARLGVLVILGGNVMLGAIVPLAALPDGIARNVVWLAGGLVAAHAAVNALTLRAAVTPWVEPRTRTVLMAVLVAVTALGWPLLVPVAGGPMAWVWLSAFTIGAAPLVLSPAAAAGTAAALVAAGALGAVRGDGSPVDAMLVALLTGGGVAALGYIVVWMLRVLAAAEAGREAEARLAVAEERLRFAQDLHDVLGHRLTVIALKAELVGGLAREDAARVEAESAEIRTLASTALREVRETVRDVHTVDLDEQLRGAELILRSAGIRFRLEADPVHLAPSVARFLGVVVREGVTNVLRHSEARSCTIRLDHTGALVRLTVVNDHPGPADPAGPGGTGLSGLAERAAALGARVRGSVDGDTYILTAEIEVG